MFCSDPTFTVAAIVCLNLIREDVISTSDGDPDEGFWAEWLAWGILVLFSWGGPYIYRWMESLNPSAKPQETGIDEVQPLLSSKKLDILALSFSAVGGGYFLHCESERRLWTVPAIPAGVLTYMVVRRLIRQEDDDALQIPSILCGPRLASLIPALAFQIPLVISAMFIAFYDVRSGLQISPHGILLFVMQCSIYCLFAHIRKSNDRHMRSTPVEQKHLIQLVSMLSFVLWTVLLILSHSWSVALHSRVLCAGVFQACHYFLLFALCLRYSSSTIIAAATVPTIAVAMEVTFQATTSPARVVGWLTALFASMQVILYLPESATYRKYLLLFLILPSTILVCQHTSTIPWQARLAKFATQPVLHPIEQLAADGQAQFLRMVKSQSSSPEQATVEYTRRYKRDPPPNFEKWFEIAKMEGYVFADEFDTMMQSLDPFFQIPASEIRSKVSAAFDEPRLIRFNLSSGHLSCDHEGWAPWMAAQIESWLPPEWSRLLPDMTFALNILDEPRVLVPLHQHRQSVQATVTASPSQLGHGGSNNPPQEDAKVKFIDIDREKTWQAIRSPCGMDVSSARDANGKEAESSELEFVSNTTDSLDVCLHPALHDLHGFLSSPDTLHITDSLVPIFSQAKVSAFSDVLLPSPYYAGKMDQEEYVKEEDPEWAQKSDTLYWSGSTTGGHASMANWQKLHRQRLLLWLKSRTSTPANLFNGSSPGYWSPHKVPMSNLSFLFDVKVSGIPQCQPEACAAQQEAFGVIPLGDDGVNPNRDPLNSTYWARFALDMDGNGFSGRYYRLLKSKVVVIKQTIFKEWHDDRLVPWVHYIPLSMDAGELPEIMRFMTQDRKGRELGQRIGKESRSWAGITLRKMDLRLAFLRLLMEYGRLVSDDRDRLYDTKHE